jgi:pilus assembly protein Flp/PilA
MKRPVDFLSDESGATSVEYALIAVIIALGLISSLQALSPELNAIFDRVAVALSLA